MSTLKTSAAIAVSLLCFLCGVSGSSRYARVVSFEDEDLVKCSSLDRYTMQWLNEEGADVWHADVNGSVTFRIKSAKYRRWSRWLSHCAKTGNVEDILTKAERELWVLKASGSLDWFDEYHNLEDIANWWKDLAENNNEVTYSTIGQSYEGRDVFSVSITASSEADLPTFYFQCLIHSREWISGSMCMYVVDEMLEAYKNGNEQVKNILEKTKLVFVPVVNPDGYEYTWTTNRLWRKNRHPTPGSACTGVDLNRNYDDHWGEGGSSGNPCSETYHGESAASEIETINVQNFFKSLDNVVGAMDWHSYSQLILRPWGWTAANTPDEERLKKLSEEMAEEIKSVHNKTYDPIKIIELTLATGGSIDWFYSDAGNVNNNYRAAGLAFELRDTGQSGFLLPPSEIIPNGEEIYPAVLHYIEDLLENPLTK